MSIIRYRNKRFKKIVIFTIINLFVLIIGYFIYLLTTMNQILEETPNKESEVVTSLDQGIQSNVLQQNTEVADIRIQFYNNIKLSEKLSIGDFVDIRIRFGNGMDFIILPKKKVLDLSFANSNSSGDNCIWLEISEEEILRMSSAFVDIQRHEGSQIYTIQYLNEVQKAAIANYPVTTEVRKLIDNDPNITKKGINLLEYPYRNEIDIRDSFLDSKLGEEASVNGEGSYSLTEEERNFNSLEGEKEDIIYLD